MPRIVDATRWAGARRRRPWGARPPAPRAPLGLLTGENRPNCFLNRSEPPKLLPEPFRTATTAFWTVQNRQNCFLDHSEPPETAFWTVQNRQNCFLNRSEPPETTFWAVQNHQNCFLDRSEPPKLPPGPFRTATTAFWSHLHRILTESLKNL